MKHLKESKHTYFSHFVFAASVSLGLMYRSVFFLIHGLMPNILIPEHLNLSKTSQWLSSKNKTAEKRKKS